VKAHIELNAMSTAGVLELDGTDISKGVNAFTLTARVGEPPVLEIRSIPRTTLFHGEVVLALSPELAAILERMGWKSPDPLGLTLEQRALAGARDLSALFRPVGGGHGSAR
jgi:hypothetical protein